MTPERWRKVEALYRAALELEPEERAAFLAAASSGLRLEVESLLAQDSTMVGRPAAVSLPPPTAAKVSPGAKLGPYQVEALLAQGGMGQVFCALDTRLRRKVAIKVSTELFSERFEREARAVAALNHSHVCQIYDVGPNYLVMELVEGQTLAERISSRPVPLAEALPILRQIAEALDAAHEKGIIHRDLKPANIKITSDGLVKVLDFGLAKITGPASFPVDGSNQPLEEATDGGVILGTAAYMAPEQARGGAVDKRADIWSFGVVAYELVTRRRPFKGDTLSDTLAAVLTTEPDWNAVPPQALPLLRRCLVKDPKRRLRDIGDAAALFEAAPYTGATRAPSPSRMTLRVAAVALLMATLALGAVLLGFGHGPPPPDLSRFTIPLPEKMTVPNRGDLALSPDGRQLVFAASGADNTLRLWLRPLSSMEPRPLPGTEDGAFPFWSPDSRFVAFSVSGKLKIIDIANDSVRSVCDVPDTIKLGGVAGMAWGGSWNRDGVIVFGASRLMRVSADGGIPAPLTVLDPSRREAVHAFPSFLPDGRHFLYVRVSETAEKTGVYVGSLDSRPEAQNLTPLLPGDYGATYVPSADSAAGQLLVLRGKTVWAQPFDPGRLALTGHPVSVADFVWSSGYFLKYHGGDFSVSATGRLVYRRYTGRLQLTWFDQQGNVLGTVGEPGKISFPRVSPDGTRVAAVENAPGAATGDVWIRDSVNGARTRFTFSGSSHTPVWSPDGKSIAYLSDGPGKFRIYRKASNGAGSEELWYESPYREEHAVLLLDWSRDGRFLLFQRGDSDAKVSEWLLPVEGDRRPIPLQHTPGNDECGGRISQDMRWDAYISDEGGKPEVYVRSLRAAPAGQGQPSGKRQISSGGAGAFGWANDGKRFLYVATDGAVMSVDVAPSEAFQPRPPRLLFHVPRRFISVTTNPWMLSDMTRDGKRFLLAQPADDNPREEFEVMLNWQSALKK